MVAQVFVLLKQVLLAQDRHQFVLQLVEMDWLLRTRDVMITI